MRFVDTNILLYAISKDRRDAAKSRQALTLLDAEDLVLSTQVRQEFYVQATRPTRKDALPHELAANLIEAWRRFPVQEVNADIVVAALSTKLRWNIDYWDAAIVEAARAARCSEILSEDLQDGMNFGGIRVRNPFTP